MNSRERFLETMRFGQPDHVPYFEEGLRPEVLEAWHSQGLPVDADLSTMFSTDEREEIDLDVYPRPWPRHWPTRSAELKGFRKRLNPSGRSRLPEGWSKQVPVWRQREHVLMMRVHHGFFLTMGVDNWRRFRDVITLTYDDPGFVREAMVLQGEFVAALTERALQDVEIDAAIFSEPIGGNHGPLISPRMYEEFVLSSYAPVVQVLKRKGVSTIILRTYANARALLPVLLKNGFDCLWACETDARAMDYTSIRQEFGRDLRLIGGIDLDVLREGKEAIRREIEEKVPSLLAQGGYVPLADGRVRPEIPLESYCYYRELLEKITRR
ncbi:MAG: uroporphyrinogen decarboxylase family protein [Anaerolineales bacterium]|jgi:uroporphyrinogen decarboxylase